MPELITDGDRLPGAAAHPEALGQAILRMLTIPRARHGPRRCKRVEAGFSSR